ncbi:UNVERIFIED_ORG: type I restriction enzyme R subunit [Arthrobacter sp. UYEF10]
MNENDTCREYVLPAILAAGWQPDLVQEQFPVEGENRHRLNGELTKRRADYVLEMAPGQPLMVIEAKRSWAAPADGLQQATRYATKLDVPFAVSTNGHGWVLFNSVTGQQSPVEKLPTPEEAWDLFCESHELSDDAKDLLLSGFSGELKNPDGTVRELRYYQRRAVHEVLARLGNGDKRILLVMATGTGKTMTAMQLVWKLWNYRKQTNARSGGQQAYKVLFLADRKVLVDEPLNKTFRPVFGDPAIRVRTQERRFSRDIYFATYQALDTKVLSDSDPDAEEASLLKNYPADFFDLVIVDECHRGSAREDSSWRQILEHFSGAAQLGMTATPVLRSDADTYAYFGNPAFEYTLKQGIEDGFLAPYTIRRAVFSADADGVDVEDGQLDDFGVAMAEGTYTTRDFERRLRLPQRTARMAKHLDDVIGDTSDRAVVFCVDAEHAASFAGELRNLRPERTRQDPEWASRIMTVERDRDRLLENFTDPEQSSPQVAVSTYLLSTGVDIQDLKYVVIARPVGSAAEFKQIIGRGTRLYPDKGKDEFEIVDYVGATTTFYDPDFDGPPLKAPVTDVLDQDIDDDDGAGPASIADEPSDNQATPDDDRDVTHGVEDPGAPYESGGSGDLGGESAGDGFGVGRTVFQLAGVQVELNHEVFYVHDVESGQPKLVKYVDWARQTVLKAFGHPDELLRAWADPDGRSNVRLLLRGHHIDMGKLVSQMGESARAPVDSVDYLLRLAWDLPQQTRAERARNARQRHAQDIEQLSSLAQQVVAALLEMYGHSGIDDVSSESVTRVAPLSQLGSPAEIARSFGGATKWHEMRRTVQEWLYGA